MLAVAIRETLTERARNKVDLRSDEFTTGGTEVGTLLFKVVVEESYVDTQATTMAIRQQLSVLDKYLTKVGGNITEMNLKVKLLLSQLTARKETTSDLIANLFKAYETSSDSVFREYIKKKRDAYEDGEEYTAQQIMRLAGNKYEAMNEANTWNSPTQEQTEIMVLKAQVVNLKKVVKNAKGYTGDTTKEEDGPKQRRPSRKYQRPDNLTEVRKNYLGHKIYWCCPETGGHCGGVWRVHKPTECRKPRAGRGRVKDENENQRQQRKDKNSEWGKDEKQKNKRVRIAKALAQNIEVGPDTDDDDTSIVEEK